MWSEGGERKVAQVLECQRTMVQNVPVLRGFAGDHTDLVSPFVMLDEFGPLQIDPGTLAIFNSIFGGNVTKESWGKYFFSGALQS